MAQCKQSPQDFIKNAFTPQIAVMCTPLAEKCCQKNNLSFIELLQPFTKLSNDIFYKDATGTVITIRNLKLTFLDVNSRPPQTTLARKFLNASVSDSGKTKNQTVFSGEHKLEIPSSTPWFESWRDTFLRVQYPSDHEYTKHFLSCVLVVSSSDNNPFETIVQLAQNLNQMQNNIPGKLPKWFSANILKYYLIIHDNSEGNEEIANESYESIKKSYGDNNCFLLRMNSKSVSSVNMEYPPDPWSQFISSQIEMKYMQTPESSPYPKHIDSHEISEVEKNLNYHPLSPDTEELTMNGTVENEKFVNNLPAAKTHGLCLSTEDVEQVKSFIFEFCKTCLIPYIEKQILQLNDVTSNKKGVSRSLFSATKRWFNPNKPGASSVAVNNLIYAPDSPELQIRRLGDLYFMFGHYNLAFQAYHLAKRDYNTDQAWLYYAGALEMASLSAFMANDANRKTCDYMEESITTYLNTCKMPQFATRATLLSSECLKSRRMYGEAALQLIRMTSEESDLRSALFLEQASYCFLHSKMIRKYAFHMVLAGHRFSKAAQRKHSLRTYKQAYQIYKNSGWDLAEDHIHYTIGRQAHNLNCFDEAVVFFAKLLNGTSKQSAQQQSIFLKEYLTILRNKLKNDNSKEIPILVLPEFDNKSLKLLMGPMPPLTTPGKVPAIGTNFNDDLNELKWIKLEEMLVQEVQDYLPLLFKPMITLYNCNNLNKTTPFAVVNEPIQLCIRIVNSLQIILLMKDIYLLWIFNDSNNESNNDNKCIKTHTVESIVIQGNSNQDLILSITPLKIGQIKIIGICYTLYSSTENILIKGKQLFSEISVKILPSAPSLEVTFSELNLEFLCDEIQKVTINFKNTGTVPLHNIKMASSVPHLLSNCDKKNEKLPEYTQSLIPALKEKLIRDNHVTSVPLVNDRMEEGESASVSIWIKAPDKPGPYIVDLLIYCENINTESIPRYRLVRHYWNLMVQESVKVELTSQQSYNTKSVEELDLVIKITNLNKIYSSVKTEMNVLNVGMFSHYWLLTEDIITPKYVTLNSEESVHVLLKAKRINDINNKYSVISLNGKIKENFNNAYLSFAKKTEKCNINIFNENEIIYDNNNGILLLQWQALVNDNNQKRFVYGQTQIPIEIKFNQKFDIDDISLNSIIISNNSKENEKHSKITYNLIYPAIVEHNFNKNKLCIIPVTLLLHSIVQDTILNVIINTSTNTNATQSNLFYPNASKNFSWLGMGSCMKTLKPLSTESLELCVVVPRPGTFDLGARLEVLCNSFHTPQEDAVVQLCHIQSALIVVNGNS